MSTNELDLDAIRARADSTHAEVVRQCEGGRWLMSVPARPGYDSDLIISETVRDVEALVAEVRRLRAWAAQAAFDADMSKGNEPTHDQSRCDIDDHGRCSGYTENEADPETCMCPCHDDIQMGVPQ